MIEIYEHYKGGRYTLLHKAYNSTNSSDRTEMVVYVSHTTGGIFVRESTEFYEKVLWPDGEYRPRFNLVDYYIRPQRPRI